MKFSDLPLSVQSSIRFFLNHKANAQVTADGKFLEITPDGCVRYDDEDVLDITLADGSTYQTKRSRIKVEELPADVQASLANRPERVREDRFGDGRTVTVYKDGSGIYRNGAECHIIQEPTN